MNNIIKFSIIIPCYNSYAKMDKCLLYLENQTAKNFEVIVVDDCSKDDSFSKLLEYQSKTKLNFKVISNKKNMGAGPARNQGLLEAQGEYILFIDSDDYISNDTIEILEKILRDNEIDCVIFDYYKEKNQKKSIVSMIPGIEQDSIIDPDNAFINIKGCTCGKAYRKKIIEEHNVEFANIARSEDMPFTKIAISYCNKIFYYKNKPLYHYIMDDDSLMHNKKLANENNAIKAYELVKEHSNPKLKENIECIFIKHVLYSTLCTMTSNNESKKKIKEKLKKYLEQYPNWYKNAYIKTLNFPNRLILFFFKINMFFPIRIIMHIKGKLYE